MKLDAAAPRSFDPFLALLGQQQWKRIISTKEDSLLFCKQIKPPDLFVVARLQLRCLHFVLPLLGLVQCLIHSQAHDEIVVAGKQGATFCYQLCLFVPPEVVGLDAAGTWMAKAKGKAKAGHFQYIYPRQPAGPG